MAALRSHAEANPFPLSEMLLILERKAPVAGDRGGFSVMLPFGYRVVFSLEVTPKRSQPTEAGALLRHLSVSAEKGRLPSPEVMSFIMGELGFQKPLEDCYVSIEQEAQAPDAINVCEIITEYK